MENVKQKYRTILISLFGVTIFSLFSEHCFILESISIKMKDKLLVK